MKLVIFCGGLGTRLREETEFRPKPLVDIGGRPILWHIMKLYAHYGFHEFILALGYRGNMIKQYFLNYEAMNNDFTICLGRHNTVNYHGAHNEQDFLLTLADTGAHTMTGGRLRRLQGYVHDSTFMVTYGDGVADLDVRALLDFHRAHGRMATVTTVRPTSRFGVVDTDAASRVLSFKEKPDVDGWVSAGFFVFERGVFDYLGGDDCVLEQQPLEQLAREEQLMAYRHDGFFYAMDTYREYQYLNELWSSGKAPWAVWSSAPRLRWTAEWNSVSQTSRLQ
ncbi:MAG: glucose-1-phosphate cytidylyltransferase [Deltaproteobacteria bacterium]|nr:glucose-1-phosphate cytidylyltransferase [Deltaproteobacteria bacterium]